jgi:hypothetical protein
MATNPFSGIITNDFKNLFSNAIKALLEDAALQSMRIVVIVYMIQLVESLLIDFKREGQFHLEMVEYAQYVQVMVKSRLLAQRI